MVTLIVIYDFIIWSAVIVFMLHHICITINFTGMQASLAAVYGAMVDVMSIEGCIIVVVVAVVGVVDWAALIVEKGVTAISFSDAVFRRMVL